jgi:hypothetical protein
VKVNFEDQGDWGIDQEMVYCGDGRVEPAQDNVQWYCLMLQVLNLPVLLQ